MTLTTISLMLVSTHNQNTKQRVVVAPHWTIKQAVQHHGIPVPELFEVYDDHGRVVSNDETQDHANACLYIGARRICGGGIPRERLSELQIEYPSIQPVKQWMDRKQAKMFIVRFPSNGRTISGYWSVVVHCPNASSALMHAYVLNFEEITGKLGVSLFAIPPSATYAKGAGKGFIPGSTTKRGHWVCHGNIEPHLHRLGSDPIVRVGAYLNHIQNLLNQ